MTESKRARVAPSSSTTLAATTEVYLFLYAICGDEGTRLYRIPAAGANAEAVAWFRRNRGATNEDFAEMLSEDQEAVDRLRERFLAQGTAVDPRKAPLQPGDRVLDVFHWVDVA
jgi:hypothetical protein